MIKPTVGQGLWFWEHGDNDRAQGGPPLAATVAYVHDDRTVNIGYLNRNGVHGSATSIRLWQGEGERPVGPYCEWPQMLRSELPRRYAEPAEPAGLIAGS